MTEKWKKKKSTKLLAAKVHGQLLKKKSIAKLFINKKKSDQICKGKCFSNNTTQQQQMDIDQEAMSIHFEEEILMDILSRLPVWSLLRFKCVSNIWKVLISDPYFKTKHLKYANNDQNSQKLLISQMFRPKDDMFSFYCSSLSSVRVIEDEQKLDCPLNCKPVVSELKCCCDGLVLLTINDKHLLLWNPSTRESVVLPSPESSIWNFVFGLGFDATSNDYKILAVNLNACRPLKISVGIFALKSGSWRNINEYPSHICRVGAYMNGGMDSLAFVHGTFHWLGLSRCYTIVSFNISNEVYGEVPLLERMCIYGIDQISQGVSVLKGTLCFYSTCHRSVEHTFKLWQMKDYGVKESWTQLLSIEDTNLFYVGYPRYMFVDGEVLIYCKNPGFIGSSIRTSRGPFDLRHRRCFLYGLVYTESLISPRDLI